MPLGWLLKRKHNEVLLFYITETVHCSPTTMSHQRVQPRNNNPLGGQRHQDERLSRTSSSYATGGVGARSPASERAARSTFLRQHIYESQVSQARRCQVHVVMALVACFCLSAVFIPWLSPFASHDPTTTTMTTSPSPMKIVLGGPGSQTKVAGVYGTVWSSLVRSVSRDTVAEPVRMPTRDELRDALWAASAECNAADVRDLLAYGAPRRWTNDPRGAPLHAAAGSPKHGEGCFEVVSLLLRAGIDPLVRDGRGRTSLEVAAETDRLYQHRDRIPLALYLESTVNGERARIMSNVAVAVSAIENAPS